VVKSFEKIDLTVNVEPLRKNLVKHPEYFGEYKHRTAHDQSPHREVTDIWVRYNDITPFERGEKPFSEFADKHRSIWYPIASKIPEVIEPVTDIMKFVNGKELGGVLITKLPPGGQVYPHTDSGWHAEYYDKYFVPIQNDKGAEFYFIDGVIKPNEGEVYKFDNSYIHWVKNNSTKDRIAMIVCIKGEK